MPPADNDALNTEMRVRRALGLDQSPPRAAQQHAGDASRPRRRFVQDGEVPVVVVHSDRRQEAHAGGGRVAELEAALEAERGAKAAAIRALDEARATIQSLQTRLTHADLAHGEELAAERHARGEAEAALMQLRAATAEVAAAPAPAAARMPAPRKAAKAKAPPKEKRSRVVKWWAPSFKAPTKTPG